jgi:hypothetical protein
MCTCAPVVNCNSAQIQSHKALTSAAVRLKLLRRQSFRVGVAVLPVAMQHDGGHG